MKETIVLDFTKVIITGVLVFVIGQIISRFLLDPISDLRKIIDEAKSTIIFRANYYCNPGDVKDEVDAISPKLAEERDKTSFELRKIASQLFATIDSVKVYTLFYWLNLIPKKAELKNVASLMIGLSNSIYNGHCQTNVSQKEKCEKALDSYKW